MSSEPVQTGAVPGTSVPASSLVSPGGQQGVQGIQGPTGVSTDPNNLTTLGSDNLIYTPPSGIWSARLRSFNAIGNPNFEVDQRNAGAALTNAAANAFLEDRWLLQKAGTMTVNTQQGAGFILLPGTNFTISRCFLRITLTGQETTLGSSDFLNILQWIEGPQFRELISDVHSVSLLVRCSVALKFGLNMGDAGAGTKALSKLCTISSANTWTLFPLPNIPVFGSGNWSTGPGLSNQFIRLSLAAGSGQIVPANDVWGSIGSGAVGQDNFAAQPVNTTFDIAFVQWEPGPLCTTLQDKPFTQNYDECLRYYQKSYPYGSKPGAVTDVGELGMWLPVAGTQFLIPVRFPKVMAKTPTVTISNPKTGSGNAYSYNGAATDTAVTSVSSAGDSGYAGFVSGGAPVAGAWVVWHHQADTGW